MAAMSGLDEEKFNEMIKEVKSSDRARMTDEEIKLGRELLQVGSKESGAAMERLVQMELKARTEKS